MPTCEEAKSYENLCRMDAVQKHCPISCNVDECKSCRDRFDNCKIVPIWEMDICTGNDKLLHDCPLACGVCHPQRPLVSSTVLSDSSEVDDGHRHDESGVTPLIDLDNEI